MLALTNPYRWVPSLFFTQALPFILITAVSSILYKNFDLSNVKITFYTSLFTLPWLLKPLLAPALENKLSKKALTLIMQFSIAILVLILACSLRLKDFFLVSGCLFFISAFVATLHDICSDGLYIVSLNKHTQAKLIGVRSLFYQAGRLVCQGGFIFAVGYFSSYFGKLMTWQIMLVVFSCIMLTLVIYHCGALPKDHQPTLSQETNLRSVLIIFKTVYQEFSHLPFFISVLCFTIFYNFPESQLLKIVPLFMMDKMSLGGLDLSVANVGIIYGAIGTAAMILGISISGILLSKMSLQRFIVPISLFVGITNFGYIVLSHWHPHSIWAIGFLITVAQFSYGLSNGAYMIYLLYTFGTGSHPMSLYAIGTALMSLGAMLAGALSGYLQSILGYDDFFIWIIVANCCVIFFTYYKMKATKEMLR